MTSKEQFDDIHLESEHLPENLRFEVEHIREETTGFTDEDASPIWEKNMNHIYKKISEKHPQALRSYVPPAEPEIGDDAKKALQLLGKRKKVSA